MKNRFHNKQQIIHAFINLKASALRSTLALLGIIVGTAAIVAIISCGQLATESALLQFKSLGTDLISISVFKPRNNFQDHHGRDLISLQQWRALPNTLPQITRIAPYSTAYPPVSIEGRPLKASIVGADNALADILHITMESGHFVSLFESFEHFCVIGHDVAQQLKKISLDSPLRKQIRIGRTLYTIIGVAAEWPENSFFNENINKSIIIPIGSMALVSQDMGINHAVLLLSSNNTDISRTMTQIQQAIAQIAPKLTVFVQSPKQIIASMKSQGRIFTLLLAAIGSISLLVGGIGVMNVMLIAVNERKVEIGIRKAVGARNQDIQDQFLIESLILSLTGGGLGILLGIILTRLFAYGFGWPFTIHPLPPFLGFIISVATGIFFGFYPARCAAKLDPMVSLRNE